MAKSNAVKRLERILNDEDYGPKLARLNRKDETYVLDLIDRNKGREARKEILRLDTERRERRRGSNIDQLRAKAYTRLRAMLKGKPATQKRGVSLMNKDQLNYATSASDSQIRDRAKAQNRDQDPTAYPDDLEIEYNVFWYK